MGKKTDKKSTMVEQGDSVDVRSSSSAEAWEEAFRRGEETDGEARQSGSGSAKTASE